MRVLDIMTKDPVCCVRETPLPEVAQLMKRYDCGEIPIVENYDSKKPLGVVTDRDIVCRTIAEGVDPMHAQAKDAMTSPCMTVRPGTSLEACCEILEENQIRRVIVVDENGRLMGVVAQADIALKAPSMQTAEVVREVSEANRPC